jgi:hypothetical protein
MMLHILGNRSQLCDGLSRREMLRAGGLGTLGLSLPMLLHSRAAKADTAQEKPLGRGTAKSCIILFLMGGPPQHSTWDPKPKAPAEVRGEFGPINTAVPGMQICELLPQTALVADRLAILRAMSTGDNAHSSSGYYMQTGYPHAPMNFENANPGFPNDYPNFGAVVRKFLPARGALPAAVRLPHRIFNTDGSVWPGQDAGFLGRPAEPWLMNCSPGNADFKIQEFSLSADINDRRLADRRTLLEQVNTQFDSAAKNGLPLNYGRFAQQAFDLLGSSGSRQAFDLNRESDKVRDRYGRSQFGQSVLLGRRLVEAGVGLVQVNWFRSPDEPSDAPCWDSHAREGLRLKTNLMPPADQAISALIEDLTTRGLLDETLVVVMAEFGRSPRLNGAAGRDHWGSVFSVALAGGGIRGGTIHGASDAIGGYPQEGKVQPEDLTATIFHCLGIEPFTEMHDTFNRPLPISRGEIIREILV